VSDGFSKRSEIPDHDAQVEQMENGVNLPLLTTSRCLIGPRYPNRSLVCAGSPPRLPTAV
jgi:hypothetical protein